MFSVSMTHMMNTRCTLKTLINFIHTNTLIQSTINSMQLTKSLLTFTAYFQNVCLTLSLHSGIRKWSNKLICFSKYANNGFSLLSIEYPRKSSSRSSSSVSLKKEFIYSRERNDASNAVINSFINGYLAKYNGSKNAFHQTSRNVGMVLFV